MKKIFLNLILLMALFVSEIEADNRMTSTKDPVIGTDKRPDPAMEIIKVNTRPAKKYRTENLDYGMAIGIERTPKGRIWACWVAGGDDSDAFFLLSWSDDAGDNWTNTKAVVDPHDKKLPEKRRTIVGNLWSAPDGALWLFFDLGITYYDGRGGTWATVCRNPDSKHPKWSKPEYIGIGFCLNKPTVLSNGEWILPQSLWERGVIDIILDKGRKENIYHDAWHEYDSLRRANVFISSNQGKNWTLYPGIAVPGQRHDENMVTEMADKTLMMTIRSKAGWIYKTVSNDFGRTWSAPVEWQPHVNSRHFIRRLSDGRLLLVRHGYTDEKLKSRSHLRAFISDDEGQTWKGGLLLDERTGVSYPDGFESPDGYIYISYDYKRSEEGLFLLARFTADDVINQKITSPRGTLRKVISSPGGSRQIEVRVVDLQQIKYNIMKKIAEWFINLYAVWIVLSFVVGFIYPDAFLWFTKGKLMTFALALVMLGMGLTLKLDDFKALLQVPKTVVIAAISQYTIMPLSGWLIAYLLGLPTEFAVGLILVACCPGGTASNMIAYIGKANLALSVISTAVSTLLGIVMTPLLCKFLAGQFVPVDAMGMFINVVQVVLIPVALGVCLNYKFPDFVKNLGQTGPVVSTIAIIFISGAIIAPAVLNGKESIINYAGQLILAASLLHGLGFGLGFGFGKLFGYSTGICKAIACETGMQNGGLAAVLAKNNFPMLMPLIAVPSVFCSVMQTVIGGVLATFWRFTYKEEE
jgi:Predicted Na+-dependent transporter